MCIIIYISCLVNAVSVCDSMTDFYLDRFTQRSAGLEYIRSVGNSRVGKVCIIKCESLFGYLMTFYLFIYSILHQIQHLCCLLTFVLKTVLCAPWVPSIFTFVTKKREWVSKCECLCLWLVSFASFNFGILFTSWPLCTVSMSFIAFAMSHH
jgi:hypothetical protein